MGAVGAGRGSFVGPRSGQRGGKSTPLASAMVDAMRTMKVSFGGFGGECTYSYIQIYDELRGALLYQICSFFEHCSKSL